MFSTPKDLNKQAPTPPFKLGDQDTREDGNTPIYFLFCFVIVFKFLDISKNCCLKRALLHRNETLAGLL